MALLHRPTPEDLAEVRAFLPPALWRLFAQMPPAEQAHGLRVWHQLQAQGVRDPDLLVAALLHDVGKAQARLRLWERVWVVLAVKGFPRHWKRWAQGPSRGWRRALAVALEHPIRGAALLESHGAPARAVLLTRHHHDPPETLPQELQAPMRLLKAADQRA